MINPNQCAVYYGTFHAPVKPHIIQRSLAMKMLHHAFSAFFGTELQEMVSNRIKTENPVMYIYQIVFLISATAAQL